jgi:hypothetical protein
VSEGESATAVTAVAAATQAARPPARPTARRATWWRGVVLLFVAFAVVGVAPVAVSARVFGLWALPSLPGPAGPFSWLVAPAPTPPDLALPRAAWVAQPVAVRMGAGTGGTMAHLAPGFPITLIAHRQVGGALWDRITWSGPTPATGGRGWVPDAALAAAGDTGPAVGDAAALAPALAASLTPLAPNVGLAVYYPAVHQLYLADADRGYPLGTGARVLLLAALLAGQVGGSAPPQAAMLQQLAAGDRTAGAAGYQQIGGSAGLEAFLQRAGLAGVVPDATDWTQMQATPRALIQVYASLTGLASGPDLGGLDATGRAQVLALVSGDPQAASIAALDGGAGTGVHVTLVVGASQGPDGWAMNAAGALTAPSGLTYVAAVCLRAQPTQPQAAQALRGIFAQLAAIATA